jgi:hypothetical protein
MAKSPVVKSVSLIALMTCDGGSANLFPRASEHGTTSWPQVQTQ